MENEHRSSMEQVFHKTTAKSKERKRKKKKKKIERKEGDTINKIIK